MKLYCITSAFLALLFISQPVAVDVLDLREFQLTDTSVDIVPGFSEGGAIGNVVPAVSLVLSLDRSEYRSWDEFDFDILLTNSGTQPLILPWSGNRDSLTVQTAGGHTYVAHLDVLLLAADDVSQAGAGVSLYGSTLLPGTLKAVGPGQSVIIRARSIWPIQESFAQRYLSSVPQNLRAVAQFSIRVDNGDRSRRVSSPPVEVTIKGLR